MSNLDTLTPARPSATLAELTAAQDTDTLLTSLLVIATLTEIKTEEEKIVSAALIGELVERFPQIDPALELWCEIDLDGVLTYEEAVLGLVNVCLRGAGDSPESLVNWMWVVLSS